MEQQKISLVIPDYSSLREPIIRALQHLGYAVSVFDYYKPNILCRLYGFLANNNLLPKKRVERVIRNATQKELIKHVRYYKPHFLLVIKGETITTETLETIRNLGVITINWFSDWFIFKSWILTHATAYIVFATSDRDIYQLLKKQHHQHSIYLPFAAQPTINWNQNRPYDITFAGQYTKPRELFFSTLKNMNFHLWGYSQWEKSMLAPLVHPFISPHEMLKVYEKSKIVVNLFPGDGAKLPHQLNLRMFETMGQGALLLTQHSPIIKKHFRDGVHLVSFSTPDDLQKNATYFLSHPRERKRIAKAGWRETTKKHTFEIRLTELFKYVTNISIEKPIDYVGKTIILATPIDSTWASPMQKALRDLGFRVIMYDYRNILGCLRFNPLLYCKLITYQSLRWRYWQLFSRSRFLNELLITLCAATKPDYVFVIKGETITQKTIEEIKLNNITTLLWQVDPLSHPSIWGYVQHVGKSYDIYISCEPGRVIEKLKKSGFKKVLYMLGAADGTNMQFLYDTPKKYDVVLVGTYDPIREKYLHTLKGLDVHVWGWGDWKNSSVAEMFEGKALTQKEMLTVYSHAKIVVNVGRAKNSTIPTNLRTFEAAQVGAFILTNCKPSLKNVFIIGREIDCFRTPLELRKKIEYYLIHSQKRRQIAKALFEKVQRDYTYVIRLKNIFKQIESLGF